MRIFIFLLTTSLFFMTGCGFHSGIINQHSTYNSTTNVVLQEANYKVIGHVEGQAKSTYIFYIGGHERDLVAQAKADMYQKADLQDKPRAIINVTMEQHREFVFFAQTVTMTAHGTVIEFTK